MTAKKTTEPIVTEESVKKAVEATKETVKVVQNVAKKEAKAAATKAAKTAKAVKSAVTTKTYVQYAGKEILTSDIETRVTEAWVAKGHRASSIKNMEIYIKPEDGAAYYVINGKTTGKIML